MIQPGDQMLVTSDEMCQTYRRGFHDGQRLAKLHDDLFRIRSQRNDLTREMREQTLYCRRLKRWNAILFMLFLLTLLACSAVMYYTPVAHITIVERPVEESGRI